MKTPPFEGWNLKDPPAFFSNGLPMEVERFPPPTQYASISSAVACRTPLTSASSILSIMPLHPCRASTNPPFFFPFVGGLSVSFPPFPEDGLFILSLFSDIVTPEHPPCIASSSDAWVFLKPDIVVQSTSGNIHSIKKSRRSFNACLIPST